MDKLSIALTTCLFGCFLHLHVVIGIILLRVGAPSVISLELPMRLVRVPPTPAAQAADPALGSPKPASPTKVTKGGARGLTGVLSNVFCMYGHVLRVAGRIAMPSFHACVTAPRAPSTDSGC